MKKNLTLTLLATMIAGYAVAEEAHDTTEAKLREINTRIHTLEAQFFQNEGAIAANTTDVEEHSTSIEANTTNIQANTDKIRENTSDIAMNNEDIETNINNIYANKKAIEANASDIATNKQSIDTNKKAIEANAENIAANSQSIETNKTAIEINKTAIEANTTAISQLATKEVAVNRSDINRLDRRVNHLETKVERGLAAQSALSGLFQPYNVGKFNLSAAVGGYNSQHAVAIGSGFRFNEKIATKAGVAFTSGGNVSYNVGVNFEF
ncbi:YadA-like family protein [Seminibacterium arietis]|uniref:YadA-like family protein n=1 Tax=Seminibacterium arietis TaxID=1173502 RepID=A0ABW3IA48_9PAST